MDSSGPRRTIEGKQNSPWPTHVFLLTFSRFHIPQLIGHQRGQEPESNATTSTVSTEVVFFCPFFTDKTQHVQNDAFHDTCVVLLKGYVGLSLYHVCAPVMQLMVLAVDHLVADLAMMRWLCIGQRHRLREDIPREDDPDITNVYDPTTPSK